jgi:hypothetical protein
MDDYTLPPDHKRLNYLSVEDVGIEFGDGQILESYMQKVAEQVGKPVVAVAIYDRGIVDLDLMSPIGIQGVAYSAIDKKWKNQYLSIHSRDLQFAYYK